MRSDPPITPGGKGPLRILIIDDHEIFRSSCRALLRTQGLDVVADIAADEHAIEACITLQPDVAIVDVTPANIAGHEIAKRLAALADPPTVVLTSSTDRSRFGSALDGYPFIAKADLCAQAIDDAANARPQSEDCQAPSSPFRSTRGCS